MLSQIGRSRRLFSITFSRPRGTSYISGSSTLPLLGEHKSQQLRRIALQHKNNVAVISHHQGIQYTYDEFNTKVTEIALRLMALGLQKGDRVGIYSPNNIEWTLTQYACARANLILVNVNPAFQSDELAFCLNKVQVKALVMAERFKKSNYVEILRGALGISGCAKVFKSEKIPALENVIVLTEAKIDGLINWKDFLQIEANNVRDLQERESEITFEDIVNIQFTSGTTGYPKAVTLSHHGMLNNAQYSAQIMNFTSDDKLCMPLPLYHCFGMVLGGLVCLNRGATIVYPNESFDPSSVLDCIEKYRCTAMHGVPTMFTAILQEKEQRNRDTTSLRTGFVSGSACPAPLILKINQELGMKGLCHVYGMTELSPVAAMMGPDTPLQKKMDTVGHSGPMTEIKLVNEEGEIVPLGQKGEVCIRGYLTMLRYWEDPEKTAETKQDGWIHSGDIGQIDEDGFLSIVGRSKDMIIRGGENISPFEIETFFDKRKWIRDIQVIGVKDDFFQEEIAAWIIPDREVTDPALMIKELLEAAQGKLAHYKLPRYIYLCEAFPLTVTGKVKKNVIRHEMNELIKANSPKVLKFAPSKNK